MPQPWQGRASWSLQQAPNITRLSDHIQTDILHSTWLNKYQVARQLDVAERGDKSYTGARDYTIGIAKDKDGNVECDPTFYLMATSGLYRGEIPLILQDDLSTNWIGYIAIGPYVDDVAKCDIVVAFRGTQVP